MSFLKKSNPYNPGYALPANVRKEALSRGAPMVTRWAPKGTISEQSKTVPPWKTGYALPSNVLREPLGRGTLVTAQTPSGTVHTLAPDTFAQTSLSGTTLGRPGSLGSLGSESPNPIQQYGAQAADIIMRTVKSVPNNQREHTLKTILNKIDQKAWPQIKNNPSRGNIARVLSSGMAQELVDLGRGKTPGSQLALAGRSPLGGISSTLSSVGGKIKDAVNSVAGAACKVANNPLTPAAAAGASSAYGGSPQTGVAGAAVAQSLCAKTPPPQPVSFMASSPSWLIPVAIGGGALLLVLALRK